MCAINGFSWGDEKLIQKMNEVMRYRGPDDTGTYTDEDVSLGNNRLAIIDLSSQGHQPMESGDGNLVIVYNGELYNFEELKKELQGVYLFKTKSDTEVILAAYTVWGHDCVKRFNGIFAFAIWDKKNKELFVARDHIGVKPFYYYLEGGRFIFSSEIKGILEHEVPRQISPEPLNIYLRIQYVPEPLSMFKGIHKLPPATCGVFRGAEFTTTTYWRPELRTDSSMSHRDRVEGVRTHIRAAVERQLISDRPIGVYLSGGFDSSIVLSTMANIRNSIDTFSVGFALDDGEEREKFNADFDIAKRTALHYGTKHHEVVLHGGEVPDLFTRVVWHGDEPISNPTMLAQLKLAEFTKSTATVVLGGDGGDELYGGYERYRLSLAASLYQKYVPRGVRRVAAATSSRLAKLNTPPGTDRFALFMFQKDAVVEPLLSRHVYRKDDPFAFFKNKYFASLDSDFERQFMDTDRQSWLVDESLMRTDKMSMAGGVEARVPLLDHTLVSFAASLPTNDKVTPFQTKKILREAFQNDLPGYIFSEPKRGFFSPGAKWLRRPEMIQFSREVLSPEYANATRDLFNWEMIRKTLDDHINRKRYNLTILWALMTFQLWAKQFRVE